MRRLRALAVLCLAGLAKASLAAAAPADALLTVEAKLETTAPGKGTLKLDAKLAPGWHANSHRPSEEYLIPTSVRLEPVAGVTYGQPRYPEGVMRKFAFSPTPLSVYEERFSIEVPVSWAPGADPSISGVVEYQACNDRQCNPPAEVSFRVGQAAGAAPLPGGAVALSAAPRGASSTPAAGSTGDLGALLDRQGLFVVLLSVFLGGLALNLTPCVYPVIPLTVGFFGRQAHGSASRAFSLAVLYVLGMAATYSALGVAAALSGRLFGAVLQNPWALAAIAAVMTAMALSMFGLWEIRIPSALANKADAKSGPGGAFVMGLFVGVLAAPGVGGFVVGLLAFVAARQDPLMGLLLFFVLSLGLGLPYLFLGAFSGSLQLLPRAGAWMESIKKVFGWVLLAMAAYFLRSVVPAPLGGWLLPGVLLVAIVALLVRGFGLAWPVRAGVAALFLAVALFFVPRALAGWQPYTAATVPQGRPAVIDFSADWCLPCLELERRTFSDPRVRQALSRRTLFKADMTRAAAPEVVSLAEKYRILGVPTVVFLDAEGREREELRLVGFEGPEKFLERLEKAP
ncbi:MAG: cytochrome c biogenesis protein CcdA [Thermoanaerobaculia bacterium]